MNNAKKLDIEGERIKRDLPEAAIRLQSLKKEILEGTRRTEKRLEESRKWCEDFDRRWPKIDAESKRGLQKAIEQEAKSKAKLLEAEAELEVGRRYGIYK